MEFVFTINLPSDASSIPFTRRIVGSTMGQLGIDPDCVYDVEVAVTEACTNVLKHARGARDEYEVELRLDPKRASIRIKDTGRGWDTASLAGVHEDAPDPRHDLTEEGGRGIMLMRALVDDLEFTSEPGAGTIVHLTKTIVLSDDSPLSRFVDVEVPRV
ncbi:MAG TPA: ATP-binding protein [Actinomycetota bacterium]|nr:ATP-binding protein [Actinomycetota bacterium]